jgi:hypothetical protein
LIGARAPADGVHGAGIQERQPRIRGIDQAREAPFRRQVIEYAKLHISGDWVPF